MAADHRTRRDRLVAPSPARAIATRVLYRVAEQGAYAMPTLDSELRRASVQRQDAALATEIVYGALRVLPRLDERLARCLDKPFDKLDGYVRAALRAAVYQLDCLSRVPPHAVVNDAVTLVAKERSAALKPLVNAVLRRLAKERANEPCPVNEVVTPTWLTHALHGALGDERASMFLRARTLPPPIDLRVQTDRCERSELMETLQKARPDALVHTGVLSPYAVRIQRAGDPRKLPGYDQGLFSVQEEGAQVVGLALGAQPGERVIDACAGHGGKTMHLAAAVGQNGSVTAIDLYENKLQHIAEEQKRLRISAAVETHAVDLSVGTGGLEPVFDRVLVDAPCTGLGTLHRRPEILLRVRPEDAARLMELQVAIVANAAKLVRPGGLLVYSVCSPTSEEGAGVVQRIEAQLPQLERTNEPWPLRVAPDEDGLLRLGPWSVPFGDGSGDDTWGIDVFQVFRWRTRGPI